MTAKTFSEILTIENLGVRLGGRNILRDLNLSVKAQQILCLLGPSGCGKSTLLKTMAGLLAPSAGALQWHSSDSKAATSKALPVKPVFGFVFQDPQLLAWRTVLENTRLPLELNSPTPIEEQNQRSLSALKKVGLNEAAHLFPHQLSGGMRMRVSIARALVGEPAVLFLDEPFAALDEVTRFRLQEELRNLAQAQNLTVVFVTHSSYEAAFLADRIVILGAAEGKIVFDQELPQGLSRDQKFRASSEYQSWIQTLSTQMTKNFTYAEVSRP